VASAPWRLSEPGFWRNRACGLPARVRSQPTARTRRRCSGRLRLVTTQADHADRAVAPQSFTFRAMNTDVTSRFNNWWLLFAGLVVANAVWLIANVRARPRVDQTVEAYSECRAAISTRPAEAARIPFLRRSDPCIATATESLHGPRLLRATGQHASRMVHVCDER
jgi:hypothetical protein